ncbi:hypothetical protein SAMN02745165_02817 [Malonomonas rubra DSM 5091]|uniref:Uncharacterized protein n=1 Tax=Malonomonas rubra DSM 5091 TaxID=1122189 RepID=A0A1M6KW83_MALRU|nr:hypothetical protein [Malonomonas rubra]SHJ63142.1 hypothetical protein SAMN02745165_02817 [Malonomonas rubra DSM 5091]
MSDKVSNGTSEDLAGLGSILKNISSRPSASKTREKIIAINSRAQKSSKKQWENDLSSGPVVMGTGHEDRSKDQSTLPVHITTPTYQSSPGASVMLPGSFKALTSNQKAVFEWLKQHPDVITQYEEIANNTGVKRETVRKIIGVFKKYDWITTERANKAAVQGIHIISNLPEGEQWEKGLVIRTGKDIPLDYRDRKTLSYSDEQTKTKTSYESLRQLTDEDIAEQYPHLFAGGFGMSEIRRLIDHWKKFDTQPINFYQSLNHADWAFEHKLKDAKGEPIGVGYVFNALKRHGAYDRPIGYKSLVEKIAQQTKEEKALLEQIADQDKAETADNEFQEWLTSLAGQVDETVKDVIRKYPFMEGMNQDKLLRTYWDLSRMEES